MCTPDEDKQGDCGEPLSTARNDFSGVLKDVFKGRLLYKCVLLNYVVFVNFLKGAGNIIPTHLL